MKYLLTILMLSGCNYPVDVSPAKTHKCTSAQITDMEKYVKVCALSDGHYASYCFDSAVENFCTPNKEVK